MKKPTRRRLPPGIVKLQNGTYKAYVQAGYYPSGKQRFVSRIRPTLAEAEGALQQLKADLKAGRLGGTALATASLPLVDYLTLWLTQYAPAKLKPNTRRNYAGAIARIARFLPRPVTLGALRPDDVHRIYTAMRNAGYADATIDLAQVVLTQALGHAKTWKIVTENVAQLVSFDLDRSPRDERTALSLAEAQQLIAALSDEPDRAMWLLALRGLRLGEFTGLRWEDVDLETGQLTVNWNLQRVRKEEVAYAQKQRQDIIPLTNSLALLRPKTKASRRSFRLHGALIAALREHRAAQLRLRMLQGSKWRDHNLVFSTDRGTPLDPWNTEVRFKELVTKAGLRAITPHVLRHSAATMMLALGDDPRTVMKLLGQSDPKILMRYTHLIEELQAESADAFDQFLAGKRKKR